MSGGLPVFPMGVGPPVAYGVVVTSFVGGPDFTTATGVSLYVQKGDGTILPSPWVGTLAPAPGEDAITPTRVLVQYPFQKTDLDVKGIWAAQIVFSLPNSGSWPNDPEMTPRFQVVDQWGNP